MKFEIGKRLKQARTNAGINQREMSSKLSLSNSSYSNYENRYSEPPVETILKFRDILGIKVIIIYSQHHKGDLNEYRSYKNTAIS